MSEELLEGHLTHNKAQPPRTPQQAYRGTSLIRNSPPPGTYSSICLGPYGGPRGGGFS